MLRFPAIHHERAVTKDPHGRPARPASAPLWIGPNTPGFRVLVLLDNAFRLPDCKKGAGDMPLVFNVAHIDAKQPPDVGVLRSLSRPVTENLMHSSFQLCHRSLRKQIGLVIFLHARSPLRPAILDFFFPPRPTTFLSANMFRALLGVADRGGVGERHPGVVLEPVENPLAGARIVALVERIQDEAILSDPLDQLFHRPSFKTLHSGKIPQFRSRYSVAGAPMVETVPVNIPEQDS